MIITITSALMIFSFANIIANQSELTIRLHNNTGFVLQVNDIQYDEGNYYHLRNLAPGAHFIRVYEYLQTYQGRNYQSSSTVLRFSGYIQLVSGYRLNLIIDHLNRPVVESSVPLSVTLYSPDKPGNPRHFPHKANKRHGYGMDLNTYNHLLGILSTTSFDNNRRSIARQAVAANGCTAAQVLGILNTFSFESTKLSFAKYAWSFCVNQQSFFIVTQGFTFESSKRELMKYTGAVNLNR
jgi:hypothetical protein